MIIIVIDPFRMIHFSIFLIISITDCIKGLIE